MATTAQVLACLGVGIALGTGCTPDEPKDNGDASHESTKDLYLFPELNGVGLCQSPINISSKAANDGTHEISMDYMPSSERVIHKAHTVEVQWEKGSTVTFDGKVYEFRQFHFHTPSEHLIDGITYPLEIHMVNTLRGDDQVYLVWSVLFREGEENPLLATFLNDVPEKPDGEVVLRTKIDLMDYRVPELDYYTYQGSLTTPPYTESVTWVIHKTIREASAAQLKRLGELEGNNARHVQPLHGREVEGK